MMNERARSLAELRNSMAFAYTVLEISNSSGFVWPWRQSQTKSLFRLDVPGLSLGLARRVSGSWWRLTTRILTASASVISENLRVWKEPVHCLSSS